MSFEIFFALHSAAWNSEAAEAVHAHPKVCFRGHFTSIVWAHHIRQSVDQPGKVANPARGKLSRENEYFPVPLRAW